MCNRLETEGVMISEFPLEINCCLIGQIDSIHIVNTLESCFLFIIISYSNPVFINSAISYNNIRAHIINEKHN